MTHISPTVTPQLLCVGGEYIALFTGVSYVFPTDMEPNDRDLEHLVRFAQGITDPIHAFLHSSRTGIQEWAADIIEEIPTVAITVHE